MIRATCPHCDKKMAVDDSKGGKLVRCPGCKSPFRMPDAPEPLPPPTKQAPDAEAIASGPPPRRPAAPDAKSTALGPPPTRAAAVPEVEEARPEEEDEPEEKSERRRKRKKPRKTLAHSDNLLTYILLGVAGVLYVGLLLLSLFTTRGAILFLIVGGFLFLGARLWFMYIARQEDETVYLLIRWVPFYAYYYSITRFRELVYPFLTGTVGAVFLATAGLVLLAHRERGDPAEFDPGRPVAAPTRAEQDRLARQLLQSPDRAEARAWLKGRPGRRLLALEPGESLELVEALLTKGAKEVVVAEIDTSDPNEEDADAVVVALPEEGREALFAYLKGKHYDQPDVGQKHLVLQ
jgi:hypothetical protein